MFVASTPLDPRRRRRTSAYDVSSPGISPIRRRGELEDRPYRLPKLPKGTTLEALRGPPSKKRPVAKGSLEGPPSKKRPLAENQNMGNVRGTSTIEVETRKSLAYLNEIISLPPPSVIPKKRKSSSTKTISAKQTRKAVDVPSHQSSQAVMDGFNSDLMSVNHAAMKNTSHFPELVVISDDEEESDHSVHHRTRRSVSSRKKTIAVTSNGVSDVPTLKDFAMLGSKSVAESRNSMLSVKHRLLPAVAEYCEATAVVAPTKDRYVSGEYTTIIKSEPQDFKRNRSTRCRGSAIIKAEKLQCEAENGYVIFNTRGGTNKDTYEFINESQPRSEPEIAKFSVAEVDSWRELKDQPGVFFSKAPAPQSSGSDGDPFPARAGYLKMEAKKILDIQTCANNVVFTVVKGKGRLKNKTEMKGSNPKTEMIIGDILTIPQGSTFNFTNLGTKNDLIMSYVKLA
uniref:UDP-N-acetylglucosamine--N-acetylmuramyl-(Pentapeptide) pyrophosphoryl-undecaprenol N-acetylglucosamine transferase n=1 Tax=Lygus hesperus TaxID=30085 RepID=A0A0A9XNQ0_LYGHE